MVRGAVMASLRHWLSAALLLVNVESAAAAPFRPDDLTVIPLGHVIHYATGTYGTVRYGDDAVDIAKRMKAIAALDPEVQTLVWLSILDEGLTVQTEANHQAPSLFIGPARLYPPIEAALVKAGLGAQAFAFASATRGNIGPGHPTDEIDLGSAFGAKVAFDAALVAYARATPRAAAWCETERARLSEDDRLRALIDMLGRQDDTDWLHTWPEPYRVLELADMLNGEVGNGGVAQYFYNDSGSLAPHAVVALQALGLPAQAAAIESGMAMFAQPYPIDTEERRNALDHGISGRLEDRLDALTEVVGYDAMRPAMIAYAKQRHLLPR